LNTTGALENKRKCLPRPASLPNAMTEPEKVSAPTKVPMKSSSRLPRGMGTGIWNASGLCTTAIAISTAAIPTSECIAATSSGICVISTRLATVAPMMPPMAIPATISHQLWVSVSVVATAIAMPTMPNRLPRREDSGEDKPFSARMNSTEAIR
jgi:hypothetical protein